MAGRTRAVKGLRPPPLRSGRCAVTARARPSGQTFTGPGRPLDTTTTTTTTPTYYRVDVDRSRLELDRSMGFCSGRTGTSGAAAR